MSELSDLTERVKEIERSIKQLKCPHPILERVLDGWGEKCTRCLEYFPYEARSDMEFYRAQIRLHRAQIVELERRTGDNKESNTQETGS